MSKPIGKTRTVKGRKVVCHEVCRPIHPRPRAPRPDDGKCHDIVCLSDRIDSLRKEIKSIEAKPMRSVKQYVARELPEIPSGAKTSEVSFKDNPYQTDADVKRRVEAIQELKQVLKQRREMMEIQLKK